MAPTLFTKLIKNSTFKISESVENLWTGFISLEESKLRSLISGRLEVLCKRNDTHKNKASVNIVFFIQMCLQKHLMWASYTILFCRKVSCLCTLCRSSFKDIHILWIQCQIQGRGLGGPGPPYCYTKVRPEGLKEMLFWTPPPPPLISWSGWPGPSLIWRSGSATGVLPFWIQKSRFEYSWQRNAP